MVSGMGEVVSRTHNPGPSAWCAGLKALSRWPRSTAPPVSRRPAPPPWKSASSITALCADTWTCVTTTTARRSGRRAASSPLESRVFVIGENWGGGHHFVPSSRFSSGRVWNPKRRLARRIRKQYLTGCHHAVIAINAEPTPGIAHWQPLPVLSQRGVVLPRPRQFEPESFGGSRVGDWLYNAKETGAKMEIMSETSKIGVRRVTRRDLGVALASITAMEACRRSPRQKYTGALNGFNDKVDTAAFNPMLHTRKLQESAPLRMTFRAKTRAEAEQWQRSLRAKVLELVGGFPEKHSPLQPQTLEVCDFSGYRREKFVFQSRPDLTVLGYLLAPKDAEPPYDR